MISVKKKRERKFISFCFLYLLPICKNVNNRTLPALQVVQQLSIVVAAAAAASFADAAANAAINGPGETGVGRTS